MGLLSAMTHHMTHHMNRKPSKTPHKRDSSTRTLIKHCSTTPYIRAIVLGPAIILLGLVCVYNILLHTINYFTRSHGTVVACNLPAQQAGGTCLTWVATSTAMPRSCSALHVCMGYCNNRHQDLLWYLSTQGWYLRTASLRVLLGGPEGFLQSILDTTLGPTK